TLFNPSAPQNLAWANGRSLEMQITLVFSNPAASSLNFLTLAAQVPVSTLGKIFKITLDPLKSSKDTVFSSPLTKLNPGAVLPISGKLRKVFTWFPFNVIVLIFNFIYINYPFMYPLIAGGLDVRNLTLRLVYKDNKYLKD